VKRFGGELVHAGTILIRQRGTRHKPGLNVARKDDTLSRSSMGGVVQRQGPDGRYIQRPAAGAGRGSPREFIASGIGKARARGCLSGLAEY